VNLNATFIEELFRCFPAFFFQASETRSARFKAEFLFILLDVVSGRSTDSNQVSHSFLK
jgi:hypothetical protein